jgi:hypothetical protein
MLAGLVICSVPMFLGVINSDVAWYLYVANRVLDGAALYTDVIETNPPLIIWLDLPPIFLARPLGISDILAFRLMVLALIGSSFMFAAWVLQRTFPGRVAARRGFLLLLLIVLFPLIGFDFGQREHLMFALVVPYLLAAATRALGRPLGGRTTWLLGVLAGVGIALKPFFVLLWLVIEGYLAWALRSYRVWLRPENVAVMIVEVIYAGIVVEITPKYLDIIRWLGQPYAMYLRVPFTTLLSNPVTILSGLALFGYRAMRPRGEVQELCRIILLANASFLCAVLVQHKGFWYHYFPVYASALLVLGLLVLEAQKRADHFLTRVFGVALGVFLITVPLLTSVRWTRFSLEMRGNLEETGMLLGRMIRLKKGQEGRDSIYVMSDLLPDAFPLVNYSKMRWASRFPSLWILPAVYRGGLRTEEAVQYHRMDEATDLERYLIDAVVSDLRGELPALLIVDVTPLKPSFGGRPFDYLEYFSRDSRFAALMRDYEPLTTLGKFRVYRRLPEDMKATVP